MLILEPWKWLVEAWWCYLCEKTQLNQQIGKQFVRFYIQKKKKTEQNDEKYSKWSVRKKKKWHLSSNQNMRLKTMTIWD